MGSMAPQRGILIWDDRRNSKSQWLLTCFGLCHRGANFTYSDCLKLAYKANNFLLKGITGMPMSRLSGFRSCNCLGDTQAPG